MGNWFQLFIPGELQRLESILNNIGEKKTSCKITLIIYVPEWTHVIAPIIQLTNRVEWILFKFGISLSVHVHMPISISEGHC